MTGPKATLGTEWLFVLPDFRARYRKLNKQEPI